MRKSRTYQDAIAALNGLQSNAQTIEKARKERDVNANKNIPWMEKLVRIINIEPVDLDRLNIIHVSGTKGKGSTCAFTESLLRRSGYRTGFFSSPHLVAVRERIRLDGVPLAEDVFTRYFWDVHDALRDGCQPEEMPPYFKFLTVMSFYVFLQEKVDVAVVEVGIGGTFDSTNVIKHPTVCGVSSLGYDHMSILGETLPEIARHKAGIFKPGVPAVTVRQPEEAMMVLQKHAESLSCPLYVVPQLNQYPTEDNIPIDLGLEGPVQEWNASLALQLCRIWLERTQKPHAHSRSENEVPNQKENLRFEQSSKVEECEPFLVTSALRTALKECRWPGRFHRFSQKNLDFFIDGAHTKESVAFCAGWFRKSALSKDSKKVLIFNSTADRKIEDLLSPLINCGFNVALFCPNILEVVKVNAASDQANFTVNRDQQLARCGKQKILWEELNGVKQRKDSVAEAICFDSVKDTLAWLEDFAENNDGKVEILVTGSLHLVGAVLSVLDPTLENVL
ncbi:hypothetical protein RvY_11333 [Ramazzottius varieornatus]|uniref:Folylpolyglutamate synthase n=1 Tax=Ramazzottius varieornatus TaxID=947166 RepID=A0A1D1VNI3_RAMVA|nr:hypothetical protein RvY_11333 [Ramazzottius varieornatus]